MKRGFTLVELIFIIVAVGILASIAVPQFSKLKQNAEINTVFKTIDDVINTLPSVYVNMKNLQNKDPNDIKLAKMVSVTGDSWITNSDNQTIRYKQKSTQDIVRLTFYSNTCLLSIFINCDNWDQNLAKKKCKEKIDQMASGDSDLSVSGSVLSGNKLIDQ